MHVELGGGCGTDTVKDVVAAVAELAPEVAASCSTPSRPGRRCCRSGCAAGASADVSPLRPTPVWPSPLQAPVPEVCELCATPVPAEHPHLVQVAERRMLCACGPCGFLFDNRGAGGGEYRRVPDRYRTDPGFRLAEAQWDALQIPVGMAFFLRSSAGDPDRRVLSRPGGRHRERAAPFGVDVRRVAAGRGAEPDVEALLGAAGREGGGECLLVPIDACYRLVGLVRLHWKGFDGGAEAWRRSTPSSPTCERRARLPPEADRGSPAPAPARAVRGGAVAAARPADRRGQRAAGARGRAAHPDPDRAARRRAGGVGEARDLFGEPSRWGETLNPLQLATSARPSPGSRARPRAALPVPLTYDLDIAATKYFHGLSLDELGSESGRPVAAAVLRHGFERGPVGVQVGFVSWNEEGEYPASGR